MRSTVPRAQAVFSTEPQFGSAPLPRTRSSSPPRPPRMVGCQVSPSWSPGCPRMDLLKCCSSGWRCENLAPAEGPRAGCQRTSTLGVLGYTGGRVALPGAGPYQPACPSNPSIHPASAH